jgi:hypothetical protein
VLLKFGTVVMATVPQVVDPREGSANDTKGEKDCQDGVSHFVASF